MCVLQPEVSVFVCACVCVAVSEVSMCVAGSCGVAHSLALYCSVYIAESLSHAYLTPLK